MSVAIAGRALLRACEQGSLVNVRACAARVLAIQNPNETIPPLKMAMGAVAFSGHTNILRYMIDSLPREYWQGGSGPWNPVVTVSSDTIPEEWRASVMSDYVVYMAAAGGIPSSVQTLIDSGMALDHIVERIGSPLGIAIINNRVDLVRFLLEKGANPNQQYEFPFVSLLNKAASIGSLPIMQLLLDHGAVIPDSKALIGAAEEGRIEAAEFLLRSGAVLNEVSRWDISDSAADNPGSALHVAVRYNQEAMVNFFLRRGIRQDLLDGYQTTAYTLAIRIGNPSIISLFKQYRN
jgi:ankyrin repeat protein